MILYVNHETHWPVRQIVYAGPAIILDQHFSDIKTNTGLKPSDFPLTETQSTGLARTASLASW